MSLTLKIGSLAIRTLAKPIANTIKRNAREHERFRKVCISFAQQLHRIDMRMRLGLLQDTAAIDRQIKREAQEAEARRKKSLIPTVKTEEETKAEEVAKAKDLENAEKKVKKLTTPRIRPLTEDKAIDSGANFISESFLFVVACGVILFENWRSRRKEKNRREDVAERIDSLETKIEELEAQLRIKAGAQSLFSADTSIKDEDGEHNARSNTASPAPRSAGDQNVSAPTQNSSQSDPQPAAESEVEASRNARKA